VDESALVSRVSELEEAMKQKAVEEVMAKAAKAEQHQQKRKSLGGSSSLKKLKGGKK